MGEYDQKHGHCRRYSVQIKKYYMQYINIKKPSENAVAGAIQPRWAGNCRIASAFDGEKHWSAAAR